MDYTATIRTEFFGQSAAHLSFSDVNTVRVTKLTDDEQFIGRVRRKEILYLPVDTKDAATTIMATKQE